MSNIDEIIGDDDFFTETTKPKQKAEKTPKPQWTPFANGEYYGHITEVTTREVNTHGGKHKALVYNFMIKVAEENEINNYSYDWGNTNYDVKGAEYIGKKIKCVGVFRYLAPKENDTFTSNPDGNKGYVMFCETIGIQLPTTTKEIDGEKVTVKSLPTIKESDMEGMPVIAVVGEGKKYTNKNGKEVTPKVAKFVKAWKNGKKKEMTNEADIPF